MADKKAEAEKVDKAVDNLEKIDKAIETMLAGVRTNFKPTENLEQAQAILKLAEAKAALFAIEVNGRDLPKK